MTYCININLASEKNHSTTMALNMLIDKISDALQNGDYVSGVCLDFSKIFVTVNHNILCDKLDFYGLRGLSLKWIKSYLCDRSQYVIYDCVNSERNQITCGVPQGSIFGPLLFCYCISIIL